MSLSEIKSLIRACDPRDSLAPDDPRYVNLDKVRGQNHVTSVAKQLWMADPSRPVVQLFAGHRGVGKTVELFRLRRILESPQELFDGEKPFKVIYIDVDDNAVDFNDLDWPDLMIFIAAKVATEAEKQSDSVFKAATALLKDRWAELVNLLEKRVTFKGGSLPDSMLGLNFEIKNRPSARQELREAIEKHATSLQGALNDMLEVLNQDLRQTGKFAGLVLLVDGLERMPRRNLETSNTHERLFITRSTQWANLAAHMVMTIPISLLYTKGFSTVMHNLACSSPQPIPMIKIQEQDDQVVREDHAGMEALRTIIEKRCAYAKISLEKVIPDVDAMNYLCKMSGGHPANLLMLFTSALVRTSSLPILKPIIETVVELESMAIERQLSSEDWKLIGKYRFPSQERPADDQERFLNLLYLLYIFEYSNGVSWSQANPILTTHPKFPTD